MGRIFSSLFLATMILVSSVSKASESDPLKDLLSLKVAEPIPLHEFLLSELTQSEYDYAEKAFTGMTFHYGKVNFNPDKLSTADIEAIALIMENGSFMANGMIHDVRGVEWIFNAGIDRPRLFTRLYLKGFIYSNRTKILSSYPNYKAETFYKYQRREFVRIPEYLAKQEEKGMKDAEWIAGQEVDRITNTNIGSTPGVEMPKRLALPAPSCNKLF